jgi:urate oxidase
MGIVGEDVQLDLADRLDRRKGRPARDKMTGVRFTQVEMEEVDRAANTQGKLFGEWAREVLLREARSAHTDALFTEIVATRMLLNLVLKPLACGQVMSAEEFSGVLANVRTTKRKAATDVMAQYAAVEPKER